MISIYCKQCKDESYYGVKITFTESDLCKLVTIDKLDGVYYGLVLNGWNDNWMYISREDYEMLRGVMKK